MDSDVMLQAIMSFSSEPSPNLVLQWDVLTLVLACYRKPGPTSSAPEHRC